MALGVCAVIGCGARTSPLSDEPRDSDVARIGSGGGDTGGDGACARCDTYSDCKHCLVQGHEHSYRCLVGSDAPEPACMNLLEQFTGDDGRLYTCFYCDAVQ